MRASARREPSLAGRLLDSPTIIPHPQPFVKGFFKSFFDFFAVFFACPEATIEVAARGHLAYYSTFVFICQAFFYKFFHFGVVSSLS